ncbi:MAG TPA: IPT/TIG domain-containing protein [Longimicrobiales bacterium]|nr:IPT/TIG domain-containing protein [Longimicrobiales bacterium]
MTKSTFWTTTVLAAAVALGACGDDSPSDPTADPPALTSISPAQGTVGTEVRIDGTGFATGEVTVRFGALESPRVVEAAGAVFALAPAGLVAGTTYDVRVTNEGSASATLEDAFTAVAPTASRINGVTKPTGLVGMTIIVEGSAFGDSMALSQGTVFFMSSTGTPIEATVASPGDDWTDGFIVTSVPTGTADTSLVWVETATGVSDSIEFRLIQSGVFSPSFIDWTPTTSLPQPLSGLGAVFVPVEEGPSPANYVFTLGGRDAAGAASDVVYRADAQQTGELGASWTTMTSLPAPRAYAATTAATAFTAALDTATTAAYLYVLGGQDAAGSATTTVYVGHVGLNGNVTAWTTTTALPTALHSAGAVMFRGFLYLAGGATNDDAAVATTYRAAVNADGTLGAWETLDALPTPAAYFALVNFGPYIYAVGGDAGTTAPEQFTTSNTERAGVDLVRLDLRTGGFTSAGWVATEAMSKARSKHSTIFGGGALFTTSGVYFGQAGSSENTFAMVNSDGTLGSWQGATGADIISSELGISLYNQAAVTFVDASGTGHVLVIGGADRANGAPSAGVVYY